MNCYRNQIKCVETCVYAWDLKMLSKQKTFRFAVREVICCGCLKFVIPW
jgi:hypothetical protein